MRDNERYYDVFTRMVLSDQDFFTFKGNERSEDGTEKGMRVFDSHLRLLSTKEKFSTNETKLVSALEKVIW